MTAADYVAKVLKSSVDYATSKNPYVSIDHHQIDNATIGTFAAYATPFWTDIARKFAGYSNELFEPFNEPIEMTAKWSAQKPLVEGWLKTIRDSRATNVIIVAKPSYDQKPGDAATDPPSDSAPNLAYAAHVYPANWTQTFEAQVTKAAPIAPVFFTEWGYTLVLTMPTDNPVDATTDVDWGTKFQAVVEAIDGSWTAWVADNNWTPSVFTPSAITTLSPFGTLTKAWLAASAGQRNVHSDANRRLRGSIRTA